MSATKSFNIWAIIVIVLVLAIVIGGIVSLARYSPGRPVEIHAAPEPEFTGEIAIGGAVTVPGIYSLREGDTVDGLLQAAGGATAGAAASVLELTVPFTGEPAPQKVDINRAESWLLAALPGIGETKAQAIIGYRRQNGPFRNIDELARVSGIGPATVDDIRGLITVTD